MSKKVALMCGHGKSVNGSWDTGTTYKGYTEAGLMLAITKAAVKYLRSYGVRVISDADTNNNKNMIVDVRWANREKVDIYVSVHCDWYKAPSGVMPLYVSASGKKLATALNKAVKSGMGMKSRGVVKRTNLHELNATSMPACILETGSIKADLTTLRKYPDKYGKAIAKGICNYLGVSTTAKKATTEKKNAEKKAEQKTTTEKKEEPKKPTTLDKWEDAMKAQYEHSKHQKYHFNKRPTVENSDEEGTCITFHSVSLQRLGLIPVGTYFYYHPLEKKMVGTAANHVRKHSELFELSYPHKTIAQLLKEGKIKKGDIIGYGDPYYHSMEFDGVDSEGRPRFNTMGSKRGLHILYPYYAGRKVDMIVRIKEGAV